MVDKNIDSNTLNSLISKFADDNFPSLFNFLIENNIKISKKIKLVSLINVLRLDVITTRKNCLMLDNRKNYRLLWFHLFTEFQLEELFYEFETKELLKDYVFNIVKGIILNLYMVNKNYISKIKLLKEQKCDYTITFDKFNEEFKKIEYESEDSFEGVKLEKIRAILYNSATTEEIKKLGQKYSVDIPETFNGDQLKNYLISKLRVFQKLTDDLENIILSSSTTKAREIAKNYNINTLKLNKKECIEFILQNVLEDRYTLPLSDLDYEMAIPIDVNNEKYSQLLFEYEKVNNELVILREKLKNSEELNKKAIEDMILEKESLKEEYDIKLKDFKTEINHEEFTQALQNDTKQVGKSFRFWLYTLLACTFGSIIGICLYLILVN